MELRWNDVTMNKGHAARAVGATGALLIACAAHAGPLMMYQHLTGDQSGPALFSDNALGAIELSGANEQFLTMGRRFLITTGDELQLVTRHDADGTPLWAATYDWLTTEQKAMEAVELSSGELAVIGISRLDRTGTQGFNPDNRISLMILDDLGNVIWANRYPDGALAANNSFTIREFDRQAAIAEARSLDPVAAGAGPGRPDMAIASFRKRTVGDVAEGQFIRIDGNGAITSHRIYTEPPQFGFKNFVLADIEQIPGTTRFVMTGRAIRQLEDDSRLLAPIVMTVSGLGDPMGTYMLPILAPQPSAQFNSSAGTSVIVGPDGEYYVGGFTDFYTPQNANRSGFVLRFEPSTGLVVWARVFAEFVPPVRALALDADGNVAICARTISPVRRGSEPTLVTLDRTTGAINSAMTYLPSGRGIAGDVIAPFTGGWLVAGGGNASMGVNGGQQPLLIRTDALGVSGCHEVPADLVTQLTDVDPFQFGPLVGIPDLDPVAAQIDPVALDHGLVDDCLNVPCSCFGDADGSQVVNFADVTTVLGNWLAFYGAGETGPGDANCDSSVDFGDVTAVLGNWLKDCAD